MSEDKKSDKGKTESQLLKYLKKSAFGVASVYLKHIWEKNNKLIIGTAAVEFVAANVLSGFLYGDKGNILTHFACGISHGWILSLIFFGTELVVSYRLVSALSKNEKYEEDLNYETSTEHVKGSADKMQKEEKEITFNAGTYETITDLILGANPKDINEVYSMKSVSGTNNNALFVGMPGTGKSRGYMIPIIMQIIRRGESGFIMDPSMELYNKLAEMGRAHDYVVKIINFDLAFMLHSDSFNFLGTIKDEADAQDFADTMIKNMDEGGKPDFWYFCITNLLTYGILHIKYSENTGYEKNLGGVFRYFNSRTVEDILADGGMLPAGHPAKMAFNNFAGSDKVVQGNTLGTIKTKMQKLGIDKIAKITGVDDIDIGLPGKKKCLYFIAADDQNDNLTYLVALFWTLAYRTLVQIAKKSENGYLPITVNMVMDEFANCGIIPDYEKKLSTVRKYHISSIMAIQGIEQLQKMFPEDRWRTIINDCTLLILLGTREVGNAEYFSKLAGVKTTIDRGRRIVESAGNITHVHLESVQTETKGQREVYTVDEILRLNPKNALVSVARHNVIEFERIDFTAHPMCKEIRNVSASHHIPNWIRELDDDEWDALNIPEDEIFEEEGELPIELCTPEDFKEPWNEQKEKALQLKIKKQKARLAGKDDSNIELTEEEIESIQEDYAPKNILEEAMDELIDDNDYEGVDVTEALF